MYSFLKKQKLSFFLLSCFLICISWGCNKASRTAKTVSTGDESAFLETFRNPPVSERTKIRMWWPSADISHTQIASEMKQLYNAGFGGVELIGISESFGRGMVDAETYGWATENWNKTVEFLMAEAEKYGMSVDLTIGPRWPAGIPDLDPDSDAASMQLMPSFWVVSAGIGVFDAPAPALIPGSAVTRQSLVSLQAARLVDEGAPAITEGRRGFGPSAETYKIKTIPTTIDALSLMDISDFIDEENQVTWSPSDGSRWLVIAFWSRGTGQTSGETDPTAYVVDHYSKSGTKAITDFWNETLLTPAIESHLAVHGGDLFEDSLELTNVDMPWSKNLPAEFMDRTGYDLMPYLPLLIGKTAGASLEDRIDVDGAVTGTPGASYKENRSLVLQGDAVSDRVFEDYHQVLNDMYIDNHIRPIMDWCKGINLTYRMQPYQLGAIQMFDTAEAAALVGVAEGESLGFGDNIDYFRVLAGGVHLGGRNIISDELGAYAGGAYNTTWQQLVSSINLNVVGGVNQFVLHGFPTKAQSAYTNWPGWHPFADPKFAEPWSDRQPSFANMSVFTNYMSRLEMILQAGRSNVDLAIYRDAKAIGNGGSSVEYYGDSGLVQAGYTYEYLSPANLLLDGAVVEDGILAPGGPSYKALLVNNESSMTLETAEKLLGFAKCGLPIVFIGGMPASTGYYGDREDDPALRKAMADLLSMETVARVDAESETMSALQVLNVAPDASFADTAVETYTIHRSNVEKGAEIYYFFNNDAAPVNTTVSLKGTGRPYAINPWNGGVTPIAVYAAIDGHITVGLELGQAESRIIGLAESDCFGMAPSGHVIDSTGEVVYRDGEPVLKATKAGTYTTTMADGRTIDTSVDIVPGALNLKKWTLAVESWIPGPTALLDAADPARNTHDIIKTSLSPIALDGLGPWKDIDGLAHVSGRGLYTTTFAAGKWDGAVLDIGDTWDNILEIKVNGVALPAIDQVTRRIDIGADIREGDNNLSILTGTTLKAAINAAGTKEAGPGAAPYNTAPYGLLGDVKIIPYVFESLD